MHPALNLLLAVALLALGYLLLRPRAGWLWRWRRREHTERVLTEDALKHLYGCHEAKLPGTIDSLGGALEIGRDESVQLAQYLIQRGLVGGRPDALRLTAAGRQYALQVIRTHRLWEQYLAERTGVEEGEWHAWADRVEHELTREQVDALAARMGDPAFDPHGDPIPSADGRIRRPEGELLTDVPAGSMVRIVHIEDEPESSYRVLRDAQLRSGMIITVERFSTGVVQIDTGAARCRLPALAAANVCVQVLDDRHGEQVSLRRLSSLATGQQATVTDISPGCRGAERRRLLDLGLVPGTRVCAELASPAGDPVAYRVRGALVALRRQQAEMIYVDQQSESTADTEDDRNCR